VTHKVILVASALELNVNLRSERKLKASWNRGGICVAIACLFVSRSLVWCVEESGGGGGQAYIKSRHGHPFSRPAIQLLNSEVLAKAGNFRLMMVVSIK
jgi:hypothetical protein